VAVKKLPIAVILIEDNRVVAGFTDIALIASALGFIQ
jgi:hypothetical protein